MNSIYDFSFKMPSNDDVILDQFKNNVILIVNTASNCGFTYQYEGLEALYKKYKNKGFTVIGTPCSQFNNQEYENLDETKSKCLINYGVTFPVTLKIDVNGKNEHPVYTYLKKEKRGFITDSIKWNFTKFLIDQKGNVIKRFSPQTKPKKIEQYIIDLLAKQD